MMADRYLARLDYLFHPKPPVGSRTGVHKEMLKARAFPDYLQTRRSNISPFTETLQVLFSPEHPGGPEYAASEVNDPAA